MGNASRSRTHAGRSISGGLAARLVGLAAVVFALALVSAASAATYPSPPHDFAPVSGAQPLYSVASGANPRPLLVVTVTFSDETPPASLADATVKQRVFGPGFPNLADYYRANSFGKMFFTPAPETCDTAGDGVVRIVYGTRASFDAASGPAENRAILDAVNARGCVNFASFDRNGDGHVGADELALLEIDATARNCGQTTSITGSPTYNGKIFDRSMSDSASQANILTLAHEVGHQTLGTRDLYGFGAGSFDLYGPTCGAPDTTMFDFNAWQKTHLGWVTPTVVARDGYYDVPRADTNPAAFILYDPDRGTNDYFIVENREKHAGTYDQDATDSGLVIWRADDSQYNSASDTVRAIDIMRTDGATNPGCTSAGCYGGSTGDAWSRANPATPQDTMARTWRDGTPSNVAVRAICDAADTMRVYFDVRGPGVMVNTCHRAADTLHPGDPTTIDFPVLNTGEATDTFNFTVTGLPAGWTASTDTQTLGAGAGSVAHVQVTPPGDAATGGYAYSVRGTSTTDASISSNAPTSGTVVLDPTAIAYTGATSHPTGEPAGFLARITDPATGDSPVVGDPVTFLLSDGVHTLSATSPTDATGTAGTSPTLSVPAGTYTLTISVGRLTRHGPASTSTTYTVQRRPTTIVYTGDLTQDYHDTANLSSTLTDTITGAPLAGQTTSFSLGSQTTPAAAPTTPGGISGATIVIGQAAGPVPVGAAFAGDATYLPSSDSKTFAITREETTLTYTGDTGLIANGRTAHLSGVLREDGTVPIAGRSVTFTLGTGASAQSCPASTGATGQADCTISPVIQPLGPGTAAGAFAGDGFYLPSADSGNTVIYQPGGAFAIAASGVLATIPRQPLVVCPPGGSARQGVLDTPAAGLTAFAASCHTDPVTGTTTPAASVGTVVLLGGLLRITGIESACTAGPDGISCSSSVGSVNGRPIGTAAVTLRIAGSIVALNQTLSNGPGRPVRIAVHVVTPLEEITLAESYFD